MGKDGEIIIIAMSITITVTVSKAVSEITVIRMAM